MSAYQTYLKPIIDHTVASCKLNLYRDINDIKIVQRAFTRCFFKGGLSRVD